MFLFMDGKCMIFMEFRLPPLIAEGICPQSYRLANFLYILTKNLVGKTFHHCTALKKCIISN